MLAGECADLRGCVDKLQVSFAKEPYKRDDFLVVEVCGLYAQVSQLEIRVTSYFR